MAGQHMRPEMMTIAIEPDLGRRIEQAAAAKQLSAHDFLVTVIERAVAETEDEASNAGRWAQLSAAAFARDWESNEDRVYDDMA